MVDTALFPTLSTLFPGDALEAFLRSWPHEVFHYPGARERLPVASAPELSDMESLFLWSDTASEVSFAASLPSARDEVEAVDGLSPDAARAAFECGMTLTLPGAGAFESIFPTVGEYVESLRRELGIPVYSLTRAIVYASPAGGGTSLHFDRNANIVAQLTGRKRWLVAPNYAVEHPTQRFSTRQRKPPHPRLSDYLTEPLPRELPPESAKRAVEVVLEPGDVLFVPYGWWHQTEAVEDSIQLNFTASMPSWSELITYGLRRHLERRPHWRAFAQDVHSPDPERRASALERVRALLLELADMVTELDADRLPDDAAWWSRPTSRDMSRFRVPDGVTLSFESGVLEATGDGIDMEVELAGSLQAVGVWLAGRTGAFSVAQVQNEVADSKPGNIRRCILLLSHHGLLQPM